VERLQISEKNENITFFFQSDIWADIYVVFIRPSHFLSAKLIKPTVFKNSGMFYQNMAKILNLFKAVSIW
jgi:hypothetical protein